MTSLEPRKPTKQTGALNSPHESQVQSPPPPPPPPPPRNWPTNRRGFDFLSLSTYLLLIFLVSKYLLLYPSTLKLKWLRPEGLVMIDCFRGAWRRGAGLSEPGRRGAWPRAYLRGSRHRGARRSFHARRARVLNARVFPTYSERAVIRKTAVKKTAATETGAA